MPILAPITAISGNHPDIAVNFEMDLFILIGILWPFYRLIDFYVKSAKKVF